MAKKKTAATEKVQLLPVEMARLEVRVRALTPMIHNRFHGGKIEQMRDKQTGKAKQAKQPRKPEEDFRNSCYVMPGCIALEKGCVYAVKANWFKIGMVRSLKALGLAMRKVTWP